MSDSDIVDIVACHPEYNNKLLFRLRNGRFITVEKYIAKQVAKQVAEQLKKHLGSSNADSSDTRG